MLAVNFEKNCWRVIPLNLNINVIQISTVCLPKVYPLNVVYAHTHTISLYFISTLRKEPNMQ